MEVATGLLVETTGVVRLLVRDASGAASEADAAPHVWITKIGDDGREIHVVEEEDMAEVTVGEYSYAWDTTACSAGEYRIRTVHAVNQIKRVMEGYYPLADHAPRD